MVVDHELNDLKREFLDEAREKVTEIQTALEGVDNPEARERVTYLAHQLKGSGGSYGYQRISADAEALEQALEKRADDAKVKQHLTDLSSEIDKCARELS